ncbi:MAG: type II toxin-antitoxin system RelE/ParE family toxin [Caulobacteraceae bacterium]
MAIVGFASEALGLIFDMLPPGKGFPADLIGRTRRKLVQLNNAVSVTDLREPAGNRLEALKGDRAGQHSIRINDQFRICFRWTEAGPDAVEFVDYH